MVIVWNKLIKEVQNLTVFLRLDLETLRSTLTSGSFELSTLRHNSWGLVLVWTHTKVSDGFSGISWTSQDQGVLTLWSSNGQLIEGDTFTTGLNNSGSGTSGESDSSDGGLLHVVDSGVVGDGTNNDDGLISGTFLFQGSRDSGDGDWWSVDLG